MGAIETGDMPTGVGLRIRVNLLKQRLALGPLALNRHVEAKRHRCSFNGDMAPLDSPSISPICAAEGGVGNLLRTHHRAAEATRDASHQSGFFHVDKLTMASRFHKGRQPITASRTGGANENQ